MRTQNSIRNSLVAFISNFFSILIAFIAQAIFVRLLGIEYLGLNGLFTNVITMLSIFELGIGNAIIYNLYKPLANKDIKNVKSLMGFYKKAYNYIALIIFIVGIIIIPFLPYIVKDLTIDINLYAIYFLFLISTLTSYVIAYKRNLIYADQNNYIIDLVHMAYLLLVNCLQLIILYLTKNYYLYLVIKIICQFLENLAITLIANSLYPYLLDKDIESLDKSIENDIFSKVKALFFHKIGAIIINGTDNIIISMYLGISQVGIYTNYYTIINSVRTLFSQIISSTTASIGNLIVTEDYDKRYFVFKKMQFLNFWISVFCAVSILLIIQPFICLWFGKDYLINELSLIVLVLNFYQRIMRMTFSTFKESAGIYVEDKYVPIIESILNILFSIVLLKFFGFAGVFMGTIISSLIIWGYSYPIFVYKKLFNRSYLDYFKEMFNYLLLFFAICSTSYFIANLFAIDNYYVKIIVNVLISLIIPNLIMIIIFNKTDNYKYFIDIIKNILYKILRKERKNK